MPTLTVHPSASVAYAKGQVWVSRDGSTEQVNTDSPLVLSLLSRFLTGDQEEQVIEEATNQDREFLTALIQQLKDIAILIPVDMVERTDPNSLHEKASKLSQASLGMLADTLYLLSGDIGAFGPFANQELMGRTAERIDQVLADVLARITALRRNLNEMRLPYVKAQLTRLAPEKLGQTIKIHLGSGSCTISDWINVDVYPSELSLDVKWGLPFSTGTVDFVFMSHFLEHLYYPREVDLVLNEVRRILKPTGIVRVIVPDIEKCIRAYVECDESFFSERRLFWSYAMFAETRLEYFLSYAGVGPFPSQFLDSHKFGYDYETLEKTLQRAGFNRIWKSEYMQSSHPELQLDYVSSFAPAKVGDTYYSLFVEARV